jgi:phosphoglycolate phosphatase-like HAD superfamily hydrolase
METEMQHRIFALDFDGVIADGLNECILVTWNGYYDKQLDDFSAEGLAEVPDWFIERFTHCRKFAKHLGHFAVAIFDRDTPIRTQMDYERLYLSLDPLEVESFVARVNEYRANARTHQESLWLDQHTLYPNIQSFLRGLDVPLYIVSAKDRDSIIKILARAGIEIAPHQVFGEQRNKPVALKAIQQYESVRPEEIFFLDDNISNVIDVQQAGYGAYWALWGYRADHHLELARQHQVATLSLEQLSELTTSTSLSSLKEPA